MSYYDEDYRPMIRRRQSNNPALIVVTGLALLVAAGVLIWTFWPIRHAANDPNVQPRPIAPRGELLPDEQVNIRLYSEARQSVVHITTSQLQRDFSFNVQEVPAGSGSGIIWDEDGRIVTNYHVIQNARNAKVTLFDGTTWEARSVGSYPDKDLAVLVIDVPKSKKLKPLRVGSSEDLQVGQYAYAIGNPFGLDQTLTRGIISALGREIESVTKLAIRGVIQTDAAINPGNSGGPLLDSDGRLIGVTTAIFSPSGASAGIGFAIPVDEVNRVVTELIKHGKVIRPGLGVEVADDKLARQLRRKGALIIRVQPGGPAAKAGLRATKQGFDGIHLGDAIIAINGEKVDRAKDMFLLLEKRRIGEEVTLRILRDGDELDVDVMLSASE